MITIITYKLSGASVTFFTSPDYADRAIELLTARGATDVQRVSITKH